MKHVGFALFRIEIARCFERQPGTDGACSIADENRCVVQVAAIARFHGKAGVGANPGVHQGVMHRPSGQRHGDREQLSTGSRLGDARGR